MSKFTKGKFKIHPKEGMEMDGNLSPYLRFCIGTAILLFAASPFLCALAYFLNGQW
ncbi:hypothetical protein [Acinetobacter defluvii]|uniref:hypothetical protein n=1 Tax=Acinetobacter defluvii TaxID=1871111 RepID=UPI003AF76888